MSFASDYELILVYQSMLLQKSTKRELDQNINQVWITNEKQMQKDKIC